MLGRGFCFALWIPSLAFRQPRPTRFARSANYPLLPFHSWSLFAVSPRVKFQLAGHILTEAQSGRYRVDLALFSVDGIPKPCAVANLSPFAAKSEALGSLLGNDQLPPLNRTILAYAIAHTNEQVGNGECWALPAKALKHAGAHMDDTYDFGSEVHWRDALPGDVIQYRRGQHHSVIVFERPDENGRFRQIHQNAPPNGKKVGIRTRDFLNISKNSKVTVKVYRPRWQK